LNFQGHCKETKYSGICAGEGQAKRLKPLPSKNFGVLATLNTAIFQSKLKALDKRDRDHPGNKIAGQQPEI
jgi:hypothetical protein